MSFDKRMPLPKKHRLTITESSGNQVNIIVGEEIGRGSSCIVYTGNRELCVGSENSNPAVIVKEFYPKALDSKIVRSDSFDFCFSEKTQKTFNDLLSFFETGIRQHIAAEKTDSKNVLPSISFYGQAHNTYYAVSNPGSGDVLSKIDRDSLSIIDALEIAISICDAISTIHRPHRYLYLDCKPDNFYISENHAYLFDFNTVVRYENRGDFYAHSPGWCAPEQAPFAGAGYKDVNMIGYHTDIFSIGSIVFWMFTGRAPTTKDLTQVQDGFDWQHNVSLLESTGPLADKNFVDELDRLMKQMLQPDPMIRKTFYGDMEAAGRAKNDFSRLERFAKDSLSSQASHVLNQDILKVKESIASVEQMLKEQASAIHNPTATDEQAKKPISTEKATFIKKEIAIMLGIWAASAFAHFFMRMSASRIAEWAFVPQSMFEALFIVFGAMLYRNYDQLWNTYIDEGSLPESRIECFFKRFGLVFIYVIGSILLEMFYSMLDAIVRGVRWSDNPITGILSLGYTLLLMCAFSVRTKERIHEIKGATKEAWECCRDYARAAGMRQGLASEAIKAAEYHFEKAIKICEKYVKLEPEKHTHFLASSFNNAALLYNHIGAKDKAKEYLHKSAALYQQIPEKLIKHTRADLACTYNNLGAYYGEAGKYELAEVYFAAAVNIYAKMLRKGGKRRGIREIQNGDFYKLFDNLILLHRAYGEAKSAKQIERYRADLIKEFQLPPPVHYDGEGQRFFFAVVSHRSHCTIRKFTDSILIDKAVYFPRKTK